MAQSIIIKSGSLHKAPPLYKLKNKFAERWKQRWFILRSNKTLAYFDDRNSPKPKGDIPLDKVELQDIKHALVLEKRNWVIAINVKAQNREYYLAADDKETMLSWVKALKEALKIDYILASEVASSNFISTERIAYNESESIDMKCTITSHPQIRPDGLELLNTEDSNIIDEYEIQEVDFESDTKRQSKVSPYEVYDQNSIEICNSNFYVFEKSENEVAKMEEYYMPMKVLNSLNSMGEEEPQACISNQESPDSTSETEDKAFPFESSNKDRDYVIVSFTEQGEIPEENEFSPVKHKSSYQIYETMSNLPANEPETINAYDHSDKTSEHLENITQKLDDQKIGSYEDPVRSSDYDDIFNFKLKNSIDEEIPLPVRTNRSYTDLPIDSEIFELPKLPPKGIDIGFKEEFRKSLFGQFQNLLETYWVMYIFLPNKFVVKELVNIDCPVDSLIQKLAKLFTRQKYHHDFNLYVISDIHQTFETKKTEKDNARNDRRLNNDMSFIQQGINSAKLLQLVSIKEIDQLNFNQYLKDISESNHIQKFCETWITFVKGYFSIPDLREVAALSGYVHYVYQSIFTSKNINYEIFLPKNAREISECVKKVREQSLNLKDTPIQTALKNFMNRISVWPTANTIAFPMTRIGKGIIINKQSDLLIVFANDHIGIVKADKNTDYSNFIYWWHKLDIGSFSINGKQNLVIKLRKPIDEGSCEFQIKSSMNKILFQLLENFLTEEKMPLTKRVSLGAIAVKCVRKPLPDIPAEVDN